MTRAKTQINQENVGKVFRNGDGYFELLEVHPPQEARAKFKWLSREYQSDPEWVEKPLSELKGFVLQIDAPQRVRKPRQAPKEPEKLAKRPRSDKGKKRDKDNPAPESHEAGVTEAMAAYGAKMPADSVITTNCTNIPPYLSISVPADGYPEYKVGLSVKGRNGEASGRTLKAALESALREAGADVQDFDGIDTPEAQALREALK